MLFSGLCSSIVSGNKTPKSFCKLVQSLLSTASGTEMVIARGFGTGQVGDGSYGSSLTLRNVCGIQGIRVPHPLLLYEGVEVVKLYIRPHNIPHLS